MKTLQNAGQVLLPHSYNSHLGRQGMRPGNSRLPWSPSMAFPPQRGHGINRNGVQGHTDLHSFICRVTQCLHKWTLSAQESNRTNRKGNQRGAFWETQSSLAKVPPWKQEESITLQLTCTGHQNVPSTNWQG